jgi:hypothetical protein
MINEKKEKRPSPSHYNIIEAMNATLPHQPGIIKQKDKK